MSFDVGQIKEIVLMDRRLRKEGVVTSVPAGYAEFAARFNKYASGPERFATYTFKQKLVISQDGSPIVWEHFLIDDSLVGWHTDLPSGSRSAPDVPPSNNVFGERTGDSKPETLSAYMKGASMTTDELTRFWIERFFLTLSAVYLEILTYETISSEVPSSFNMLPV